MRRWLIWMQPRIPTGLPGSPKPVRWDGAIWQAGNHIFRIGHLRHAFWMNEARDLKPARAVTKHALAQLELALRRDDVRFVLKPVARTDFDQFNRIVRHLSRSVGRLGVTPDTQIVYKCK